MRPFLRATPAAERSRRAGASGAGCLTLLETIALVPFDPHRDAALLERWLQRPHVAEWWGPEAVASALAPDPASQRRLIVRGERPVGFITWHRTTRAELDAAALHEIPAGGVDFDLFIGEAEELGRGTGPAAISQAIAEAAQSAVAPYYCLCTAASNQRAQRAFRKAGFVTAVRFDEGRGPHDLMMRTGAAADRDGSDAPSRASLPLPGTPPLRRDGR